MMDQIKLKQQIFKVLKADDRLWNEDKTEFNQTLLLDLVENIDENIINLFLQEPVLKEKFFVKIKDVYVFKTNDFRFFMEENKLDNSYTAYKNRIGLTDGKKFLKDTKDVVLDFPYKDCVLEGGQSTEEGKDTYYEWQETTYKDKLDEHGNKIKEGRKNVKVVDEEGHYEQKTDKRKEIFFNSVLAHDEIDRLFDPKALVNWKRYTKDGEQEVEDIKRNEDGIIKENMIIKGNNLLALHSLKKEFTGKVKLIYIDPPYNTGNDDFGYNDNFKHSAWLTFMKNRLEVARELLRDDGVIFIQCDHHEMGYLNILLDEIFGINNKIQQIAVKVASASGFKAVNPGPIDVLENILYYAKNKKAITFRKNYVPADYHKNYNKYFERYSDNIDEWKLIPLKEKVIQFNGFKDERELKDKLGDNYKIALKLMIEKFAFENADSVVSVRDLHKPTKLVKELQKKSKKERNKIFVYKKQDGDCTYIINGGAIAFYSSKIKEIDGHKTVTELLTNFWDHISWAGIAKEGGVSLKNGKKPEKLIKQILELHTDIGDIVLDYHMGSGTTCAVAHKMGLQYIGVEQLYYGKNSGVTRLQNVIDGDQSGISKSKNWQGGGDFVYFELAKWNETAKEKIIECKTLEELINLFDEMYESYFLNYNLKIKEFKEKVIYEHEFKDLSLEAQKKMFITMLDNNQMYVNKTEMSDKKFGISEKDQELTLKFYSQEK